MARRTDSFPLYFDGPKPFGCNIKDGEILYLSIIYGIGLGRTSIQCAWHLRLGYATVSNTCLTSSLIFKTLTQAVLLHQPPTTDLAAQRAQKEAVGIAMMMTRVPPQILSSSMIPSFSDVCSMLLKVTPLPDATDPPSQALLQHSAALPLPPPSTRGGCFGSSGRGRGSRPRPKCTYYDKDGHLEATCYRKHGLPPRSTASVATDTSSATCTTHHITSLKPSKSLNFPHPKFITIANGDTAPVPALLIYLSTLLFLFTRPFMSRALRFNLLSVSRLIVNLDCSVTFITSSFMMHDRQTQSIIGKRRLHKGLYLLDASPTILSSISFVGWHRRLGHAPLLVLKKALLDVPLPAFTCDSCIFGKQHRSSFPPRFIRSAGPFDLVHSDV
ncbi:hypothetical protein KSP39_PZI024509 [Platanthera zijinensis]|uniref:GAG-pre-integrase domain-containing protein n=1 Tax=Platanthera zijinensis TaxID=2320716 RepID=A0AAP0FU92_9ASPA